MRDRDEEFAEFADVHVAGLRRTAFLLCGDWHRAEDLVQVSLLKLFRSWPRVSGPPLGYVRRILTHTVVDESRRLWRREKPTYPFPDAEALADDRDTAVDLRRAMATLPPRQRAALVLRYWDDLPISEVARVLGCTEGTVKSQSSKGLATLRQLVAETHGLLEGHQ
jgi:RNA polymerase sigma-70 factor (sigma-E family)